SLCAMCSAPREDGAVTSSLVTNLAHHTTGAIAFLRMTRMWSCPPQGHRTTARNLRMDVLWGTASIRVREGRSRGIGITFGCWTPLACYQRRIWLPDEN